MRQLTEPRMLLDWARDLGRTHSFMDLHVHPFDVLSCDVDYSPNKKLKGLFSKGPSAYRAPASDERIDLAARSTTSASSTGRAFLLASRLQYAHTGSRVMADQIGTVDLAGALLLPVARLPGEAERLLEAMKEMFQNAGNLYFGCAYPVGIPADRLAGFFCAAREHYDIRAIKIHPNLAGIDPLTQAGHELIEATLQAAGALGLTVITHAGRTCALKPSPAAEYGLLSHLETVNWALSSAPVIVAHAGCYGLAEDEADAALAKLEVLLQKYPNLMADTSNLEPWFLRLVLKRVSRSRLIFGSDALYVPVWKAWLRFLQALREISPCPDDDLVRIASLNPAGCLGLLSRPGSP